jgi:hypothetical protein
LAQTLAGHGVPQPFINGELAEMSAAHQVAKTNNRSVMGIMNEFSFLVRSESGSANRDLFELSNRLAATPCGPLYGKHVSPDRELLATVAAFSENGEPMTGDRSPRSSTAFTARRLG